MLYQNYLDLTYCYCNAAALLRHSIKHFLKSFFVHWELNFSSYFKINVNNNFNFYKHQLLMIIKSSFSFFLSIDMTKFISSYLFSIIINDDQIGKNLWSWSSKSLKASNCSLFVFEYLKCSYSQDSYSRESCSQDNILILFTLLFQIYNVLLFISINVIFH